jgi:DNA-binding NtrC family response regulator
VSAVQRHFLAPHGTCYRKANLRFEPAALERLQAHARPRNVREMRNMIEECAIMARSDAVGPEQLNLADAESAAPAQEPRPQPRASRRAIR